MEGFDLFGAESAIVPSTRSWTRSAVSLAAGAVGALVIRKHPVLAFLGVSALAGNVQAVHKGERTMKDAIKRMGRHVVATAGSLALPAFPIIGYVAGAIAGDLLIDGEGGGIIEEWAPGADLAKSAVEKKAHDVIDAEIVEVKAKPNAIALVKK